MLQDVLVKRSLTSGLKALSFEIQDYKACIDFTVAQVLKTYNNEIAVEFKAVCEVRSRSSLKCKKNTKRKSLKFVFLIHIKNSIDA